MSRSKIIKRIKWVGIIAGMSVALVLLLVGALLFSTSMQRSIALRVLAAQADNVELEGVQLSPSLSALELTRLSLVKEDIGIELASAQLKGSFVQALFGNDIRLDLVQGRVLIDVKFFARARHCQIRNHFRPLDVPGSP